MEKRLHLLGPSVSLNNITPCAACKLLRRRCAEECPFSPYFSPHEPHRFLAVHKVFGASNVSKLLMEVPESQRADAANSLVYEANVRIRDPVYGCMGAIAALQQQLHSLQAQLDAVRSEILKHDIMRSQSASATPGSTITVTTSNAATSSTTTSHRQHQLMRSSSGTLSAAVAAMPMLCPPPPQASSTEVPQRPLTPPLHQATAKSAATSNSSSSSTTTSTAVTAAISSLYSTAPNNSNSIRFTTNNDRQGGYMCFD